MCLSNEIEELYKLMEDILDDDKIEEFTKCDIGDLHLYHFTLGLWLRNNILKDDSLIYQTFVEMGITSKDDVSAELIEGFYIYLNLKDL